MSSSAVQGRRADIYGPSSGYVGEFELTGAQNGSLYSAFMVGLLVGSPIFSEASKYFTPFRVCALGLGCWVACTAASAAAPSFGVFLAARLFVGLGEAAFATIAPPYIDDAAPAGRKTRWLGVFFVMQARLRP